MPTMTENSPRRNDIARRWTPSLVQDGWAPISIFFLDNYYQLRPKLSSLEAMFVVHLMRHKWDERHPYPTFGTLARRMGVSATSVRNYARSLERNRYLNRIVTQGAPNQFDLTPLFDALERLRLEGKGTNGKLSTALAAILAETSKELDKRRNEILSPPVVPPNLDDIVF